MRTNCSRFLMYDNGCDPRNGENYSNLRGSNCLRKHLRWNNKTDETFHSCRRLKGRMHIHIAQILGALGEDQKDCGIRIDNCWEMGRMPFQHQCLP